ncbi:glycosyltransferase family 4 protein [Zhongshania sp.]|uniref:glycosyltransferase family 4 protein n=1 Tax=Zhongshania sp. TaxID=1971902 RepID=UPI0039E301EC
MGKNVVHITSVHPRYDTRIFHKECLSLVKFGYDVSLIVADGIGCEVLSGVSISDVGTERGRIKRFFLVGLRVYRQAINSSADIYHIHDPELIFVGLLLRLCGKKVVFDSHEDVPKQILDKPYFNKPTAFLVSSAYRVIERLAIPLFSGVVAATSTIRNKFAIMNSKVIDVNNFPTKRGRGVSGSVSTDGKIFVCYVGAISETRGILEIVDAMDLCRSNVYLLLGGKFGVANLKDKVSRRKGWSKVDYLGYLSRDEVDAVLSRSVAGLVTLYPTASYVEALPVKMFEYMNAGIPVISSDFKILTEIVKNVGCGLCVNPKDPIEIAKAIDCLVENSVEAKEMGLRGKGAIDEVYNWDNEENKLIEFYDSL